MIDGLRLRNVRVFEDTGWMDIAPLTLILGRNSVGKSTIARWLPLLGQSMRSKVGPPIAWTSRDGVDFGSFREALRRGGPATLAFEISGIKHWSSRAQEVAQISIEIAESSTGLTNVSSLRASALGMEVVNRPGGFTFSRQATRHEHTAEDWPSPADWFQSWGRLVSDGLFVPGPEAWLPFVSDAKLCTTSGVFSLSLVAERTTWVAPFRAEPQRSVRSPEPVTALDPRGAGFVNYLIGLGDALPELSAWSAEALGLGLKLHREGSHVELQVIEDGVPSNIADVGFGISQVFPVLAHVWEATRANEPRITIIEQPELHLHPAHQYRLGRAFAEVAAAAPEGRLIVETHSEALVQAAGDAIADGRLKPEQVNVLMVEAQGPGTSTVRNVRFDAEGYLTEGWPAGFFAARKR